MRVADVARAVGLPLALMLHDARRKVGVHPIVSASLWTKTAKSALVGDGVVPSGLELDACEATGTGKWVVAATLPTS